MVRGPILALLALAGCATEPRVVMETGRSITMCYSPLLVGHQSAADRAKAYCAARGLHAQIADIGECPGGQRVSFNCVE